MSTIFKKLKSAAHNLPHGTEKGSGIMSVVVDKGERFGAAFGFGFAKGYYGEKFVWKDHGADLWIGVGSLAAATLASTFGGRGAQKAAVHLERIGDAGVMSALSSLGAAYGLDKAGNKAHVTTAAKKPAAVHGIAGSMIGAIGEAKGGPYLSNAEMLAFSQKR